MEMLPSTTLQLTYLTKLLILLDSSLLLMSMLPLKTPSTQSGPLSSISSSCSCASAGGVWRRRQEAASSSQGGLRGLARPVERPRPRPPLVLALRGQQGGEKAAASRSQETRAVTEE